MVMAEMMPLMYRTAGVRIPIWLGIVLLVIGLAVWVYAKQRDGR